MPLVKRARNVWSVHPENERQSLRTTNAEVELKGGYVGRLLEPVMAAVFRRMAPSGGHCHCIDCRKSSGTGHCSHMIVPEAAFKITGDVRFFDKPADSGNMISRGFCPDCGSPIYSKNSGVSGMVFVRASSLDDPQAFRPQMVVYTDRAASWDHMDPLLPRFAAMPSREEMPEEARGGERKTE